MVRWTTLAAALVASCGVLSPEEQLLTDFFEAARLHDTTVVARWSSVTFDPSTDGVVQAFEVAQVRDDGDIRRVDVHATVRQRDGAIVERTLVVAMERRERRWFITAIDDAARDGP